jgi:hypothetical protein
VTGTTPPARPEKKKILDEFIQVTGYHRKHAIRAEDLWDQRSTGARIPNLRRSSSACINDPLGSGGPHLREELKEAIPTLVDAMVWASATRS